MKFPVSKELGKQLYMTMVKIRRFEENVSQLYARAEIPGFMHLYIGEEAVATGVCSALRTSDYISSTHRGHGHCIAKGGRLNEMMAELFGRKTGYCKGKGGSMHIADVGIGILGANGIVAGGIPGAVGAGVGIQYKKDDAVSVCFFGDGATTLGGFHESCNLAAVWELPVIFICENNGYAMTIPRAEHQKIKSLAAFGNAYGMPGVTIDGNDVAEVYHTTQSAVAKARKGGGPTFIECNTYRWHGHWEGDPQPYRTQEEVEAWKPKCPILRWKNELLNNRLATAEELTAIEKQVDDEIRQAIEFARASEFPKPEEALEDIYTL
jgi:acetoin:2,6-dichlorophenolindophenol oxidoreductase subunit alpha